MQRLIPVFSTLLKALEQRRQQQRWFGIDAEPARPAHSARFKGKQEKASSKSVTPNAGRYTNLSPHDAVHAYAYCDNMKQSCEKV